MLRRLLPLALVSSLALAQEPTAPELTPPPVFAAPPSEAEVVPAPPAQQPVVPMAEPEEGDALDPGPQPTYLQRCFSVPAQVWVPLPNGYYLSEHHARRRRFTAGGGPSGAGSVHQAVPVGNSGAKASGGSSASGGGGIDGKAALVLAVVVVAALPIIVYALDSEAPEVVAQRFHCPSVGFDFLGGVDLGTTLPGAVATSGRLSLGWGYLGADFQFDLAPGSISAWASHVLLRFAPRAHVEPAVAFGYRTLSLRGAVREGLELGVPHRYVFWRSGLRQFGVEFRPALLFTPGGLDASLEGHLVIPVVEPLHLRSGVRVQTFGPDFVWSFSAGLSLSL